MPMSVAMMAVMMVVAVVVVMAAAAYFDHVRNVLRIQIDRGRNTRH